VVPFLLPAFPENQGRIFKNFARIFENPARVLPESRLGFLKLRLSFQKLRLVFFKIREGLLKNSPLFFHLRFCKHLCSGLRKLFSFSKNNDRYFNISAIARWSLIVTSKKTSGEIRRTGGRQAPPDPR
jgi:hypothetical protein